MDKDDKSRWEELWEELSKMRFWAAIAAILISLSLYALLGFYKLPEGSWPALVRDFLMALITNFVPTFLIFVFGYVYLRKIQAIKSKEERDALFTEIRKETRNVLAGELQTVQQTIDNLATHNELGNTTHSLGIASITSKWVELRDSQQPLGAHFRRRLSDVKSPATWYLLTIAPSGLGAFNEEIRGAIKRGINVKWVYYADDIIDTNPALKTQWGCLSRFPDRTGEDLKKKVSSLLDDFGPALRHEIQKLGKEYQKDVGNLEFYESEMVHPYLAFLSVPENYKELPQGASPKPAPVGTFGFVHLYPIFPCGFEERPALYLDASGGEILDEYYWSTLRLFDWGVGLGKIRRTWSLKTEP
jgi:hypothetical protein